MFTKGLLMRFMEPTKKLFIAEMESIDWWAFLVSCSWYFRLLLPFLAGTGGTLTLEELSEFGRAGSLICWDISCNRLVSQPVSFEAIVIIIFVLISLKTNCWEKTFWVHFHCSLKSVVLSHMHTAHFRHYNERSWFCMVEVSVCDKFYKRGKNGFKKYCP